MTNHNEAKASEAKASYKTRRLSPTGKILLAEIIPALKSLRAGKALLIEDPSPPRIDQIRSHLYTYFSESSQKQYFRTIRESATTLRIICQDLTKSTLTVDFSSVEIFVMENLLECESFDEASAITRSALTAGEISDVEFLAIMKEWEAQCAGEPVSSEISQTRMIPLNGSIKSLKEGE
jgi:hypothetical protein